MRMPVGYTMRFERPFTQEWLVDRIKTRVGKAGAKNGRCIKSPVIPKGQRAPA